MNYALPERRYGLCAHGSPFFRSVYKRLNLCFQGIHTLFINSGYDVPVIGSDKAAVLFISSLLFSKAPGETRGSFDFSTEPGDRCFYTNIWLNCSIHSGRNRAIHRCRPCRASSPPASSVSSGTIPTRNAFGPFINQILVLSICSVSCHFEAILRREIRIIYAKRNGFLTSFEMTDGATA